MLNFSLLFISLFLLLYFFLARPLKMNTFAPKRAEEELIKLRKAVEASGEVMVLTDRDGTIKYVNPQFTSLYGYNSDEVVDKVTPRILKSGKMDHEYYEKFWQTILDKQVVRGEFLNKTKDGKLINIEGSANPVLDENGNIIGFLAIQRDITERIKLEKLRDDLTHMIVHDLKNPLTGIVTAIEIVEKGMVGPVTEKQKESLQLASINTKKLSNLIMDLLDIKKIEEHRLELQKKEIKVDELIKSLSWIKNLARREGKQMDFQIEEGAVLSVDKNLIVRVLENLLTNAIKHTPRGGNISLNAKKIKDSILFEVIDTGEGIPKEYHNRVFDRFFKVESQTLKTNIDTGLGLTFCKMVVEAHEGTIGVESEVGKGSRFYVYLPIS